MKHFSLGFTLFLFFSAGIPSLWAQKTLSIQQAYSFAIQNNPLLLALLQKRKIAYQKLQASKIFPSNPDLGVKSLHKVKTSDLFFDKAEISLSWKMPIGGWWSALHTQAMQEFEQPNQTIQNELLQLKMDLMQRYFALYISQKKATLYKQLTTFYERILWLTQKRVKAGLLTILDQNYANIELAKQKYISLQASLKVQQNQIALLQLLGAKPKHKTAFAFPLFFENYPLQSLQKLQTLALQFNPKILLLKKKWNVLQAKLSYYKRKRIPDLKLKLFYAYEEKTSHMLGGGLEISLPFLQRQQAYIEPLKAKKKRYRWLIEGSRLELKRKIQYLHKELEVRKQISSLFQEKLLQKVDEQLQLQSKSFELGQSNILKVIASQESQNKAFLLYFENKEKFWKTQIKLMKWVGQTMPLVSQ